MAPLVSFVGRSGVGKTTVLEQVVKELDRRGYRVAVIKHHAHPTQIDNPAKDSARYAAAGARVVMVSSPIEVARFERVDRERTLAELAATLENVDLVVSEGFKREPTLKIEVTRAELGRALITRSSDLVAVVSDYAAGADVPQFALDDIAGLTDWIEGRFLR